MAHLLALGIPFAIINSYGAKQKHFSRKILMNRYNAPRRSTANSKRFLALCLAALALVLSATTSALAVRLKDIASVKGVRNNQLIGYGLIVGLNGTGDGAQSSFTTQGLINMLENMGV